MNLDDLKAQWRHEMQQASQDDNLRFERIKSQVSELRRTGRNSAFWMIFANACGSALALFFGWLTRDDVDWHQKLSIAAYVVGTLCMTFFLLRARRISRSDDWTLRSRLEMEIERLEKQRNLWNNVGAWFFLPMSIASLLALSPRLYPLAFALYAIAYWVCRSSLRRQIDPLLSRLRDLHRELVESM
jgi:hypothetical protein